MKNYHKVTLLIRNGGGDITVATPAVKSQGVQQQPNEQRSNHKARIVKEVPLFVAAEIFHVAC